jgi:predicted nucleic acid-binding protein
LEGRAILVPALWSVEITNAVLMAERRKRVKQPEIRRFVELLGALTVNMDSQSIAESVSNILPIAREYGLSAYDAAYLDVAVRHGVPLATLDSALQKAGRKAGIEIFRGNFTR